MICLLLSASYLFPVWNINIKTIFEDFASTFALVGQKPQYLGLTEIAHHRGECE